MSVNLTEIIAAIAHLDRALSRADGAEDGLIAITIDPKAFDAILAEYDRQGGYGRATRRWNRFEMATVVVRSANGRTDTTQPEIKKRAG